MPGGSNPHKPLYSSFSAHSHHSKSRWEPPSSTAAAHKPSAAPKSKPSINPPTKKDPNNKNPTPKPKPSPRPENPNHNSRTGPVFPFADPPPPPSYGFQILDRRSVVLADGSVRSYFALPPDYENFMHMPLPNSRPEFREFKLDKPPFSMSPGFQGHNSRTRNPENWNVGRKSSLKRKFGEDERGVREDGFERQRQQLLQYGNVNGPGPSSGHSLGRVDEMRAHKNMRFAEGNGKKLKHSEVDQNALKKAFLHFLKLIFETASHMKNYLGDGKQGPLLCLACSRSSKYFPDTHSLILHAYNSDNAAESVVDHLAFHKALCILMGWNYSMPPDNSKAYQNVSAKDVEANVDDLIMWPPSVLIHNTITGKGRDGRMEGIGNRAMDSILRDIGCGCANGKSLSLYSREGHLGIHTVRFSSNEMGLKEALELSSYFEREKRGRKEWAHVQPSTLGKDDESNPNLVKLDPRNGDKKRILYGHLATVADLDKVTFEIKKKVSIVSIRDFLQSK